MQLTDHMIAEVAHSAGFTGHGLTTAVAVALAESAGKTLAVNTRGNTPPSRDRGLWQINSYFHPEVSDHDAFDPLAAARAVWRISKRGTDWREWTTYQAGHTAPFMHRAQLVADQVEHGRFTLLRTLRLTDPQMFGADVAALQHRLSTPAADVKVDGVYGPLTVHAVQVFQHARGLDDDGVVGALTARALGWEWEPLA